MEEMLFTVVRFTDKMFNLCFLPFFFFFPKLKLMKLNSRAKMYWFILNSSKNCDSLERDVEQILDDLI